MRTTCTLLLLTGLLSTTGCGFLLGDLAEISPPLHDMEEFVELLEEPDDEELRQRLPRGVFTGIYVEPACQSLDEMVGEGPGVMVQRIVENSAGSATELEKGDILLEVTVGEGPQAVELAWPSDWRALELNAVPGDVFHIVAERAGVERACALLTVARLEPAEREKSERFREEQKVGIVVRTATEVEARQAGLAPGAGAVVVGMARGSPWRSAGLQFRDMIIEIDGRPVGHPQVVLDAIREAQPDDKVAMVYIREGQRGTLEAPLSRREEQLTDFTIPLLFSHEKDRGTSETSFLLGLLGWTSTPAAWEFKLLWIIRIRGGDADRLKEVQQ